MNKLIPMKRTALDGHIWWVVWDTKKLKYCNLLCFGQYRTKKACQMAINAYYKN